MVDLTHDERIDEVERPGPSLGATATVAALATVTLAGVLVVAQVSELSVEELTRDPNDVAEQTYFVGALSQLGGLIWTIAAAISLFTALIAWQARRREPALFLAAFGAITLVLAIDDVFLVHERFWPHAVGGPEFVLIGMYAVAVGAALWRFRQQLLAGRIAVLVVALGCFAASVLIDRFTQDQESPPYFIEDSFKFLGIVAWALFFVERARWELATSRPSG